MNILIGILSIIGILSLWCLAMFIWTPSDEYEECSLKQNVIATISSLIGICLIILVIIWMFNT